MQSPLGDITNITADPVDTAATLEGWYTQQADADPIHFMRHGAYFMSLEDLTLNGVSNDVANLAMERRTQRHLIPEWIRAIENNMDYNVGAGPAGLARKMDKYQQWVSAGMGEERFAETDSEDENQRYFAEHYDSIIDTIESMERIGSSQAEEDRMNHDDIERIIQLLHNIAMAPQRRGARVYACGTPM